jgi:hypothetical protein
MRLKTKRGNERGFVLMTCMALLLMFGLLGVTMIDKSSDDMGVAGNQLKDTNALYGAEAAADYAYALFDKAIDSTNAPPNPLPTGTLAVDNFNVQYQVNQVGAPSQRTLTQGAYAGLYGIVQDYDIWGYAKSDATGVQNSVRIRMERALIPLFQFAIFYNSDLEFHPGPAMTINGRVHSNSNLYLDALTGLKINSFLTASGNIVHGKHPLSGEANYNGPVDIMDASGAYKSEKLSDGTWLDHNSANWMQAALDRWGGRVKDAAHGIFDLKLPLEAGDDPRNVIKDASGGNTDSYENKANLKIMNGTAYFKSGATWIDVTATLTSTGVLSNASYYDYRNKKTVSARQIDISKLNTSAYWPTNGILYTKDTQSGANLMATRLVNGSTLKAGLTVVSENPVYTKGNYNSTSKKPAAIMSDAFTVLSGNWNDANGNKALSSRQSTATTVNASFITGNVPTGGGKMSGGTHNLPRFLEDWTSDNFTWSGSMVQMWQSVYATGAWSDTDGSYSPPNRIWSFDTDLLDPAKLPPGTPMVNAVVKRGWANTGGPIASN